MMPPFVVFPTNRITHFVEVSLYLFYLAQRVKLSSFLSLSNNFFIRALYIILFILFVIPFDAFAK